MRAESGREWDEARRGQIAVTAEAVLAGRRGVVKGALRLWRLRPDPPEGLWADPDFHVFGVVDSEVDDLPAGPERALWDPETLARKDAELDERAAFYRDEVLASCERLVRRFGRP